MTNQSSTCAFFNQGIMVCAFSETFWVTVFLSRVGAERERDQHISRNSGVLHVSKGWYVLVIHRKYESVNPGEAITTLSSVLFGGVSAGFTFSIYNAWWFEYI